MSDLIKTTEIKPAEVFVPNGLDPILKEIDQAVSTLVPDISTEKGRKEITSICYKIKRSKTYLDGLGKDYVAELKKKPKIVDAERKRVRDYLDGLEEDVRKPLTEWEEAEEKRKADILSRINAIDPFEGGIVSISIDEYDLDGLNTLLYKAQKFEITDSLDEYKKSAETRKEEVILKLEGLIAKKTKQIEEQAELERLRKEAAEREQKERDKRLKQEAAERARKEAEAKAKAEQEAAERKAKEEAERMEREKQAAIAAQEAAERRAKEVEENAKAEAERAAQAERERIEAEKKAEKEAAKKREANKKHYAKINNNALLDFVNNCGLSQVEAKLVVEAIAKKKIRNVSITY